MQHHETNHHGQAEAGWLEGSQSYFENLEGVLWIPVLAAIALVLAGTIVAILGAARRKTTASVIGVALVWCAFVVAFISLAKMGHHELLSLVRATQAAGVVLSGLAGLLLLIQLGRAPLTRTEMVAGGAGTLLVVGAWLLFAVLQDTLQSSNGVRSALLWGSFIVAALVALRVAFHLLQREYEPPEGEAAKGKPPEGESAKGGHRLPAAILLGSIGLTMWTGYELFGKYFNDPHVALHIEIMRLEEMIAEYSSSKEEVERYVVRDKEELRQLKNSGKAGQDPRGTLLERSIRKNERAVVRIETLIPALDTQLWMAHRIEEEAHRLDSSSVAAAAHVLHEVIAAATGAGSDEIDAILDRGADRLSGILDQDQPHP